MLLNSGAEAVENAVKIARAATGRAAVIVFERGFHGRTLLTLTMTEKVVYKAGFGPFAPEVYRVPAPYPYRGVTSDEAIAATRTAAEGGGRPGLGRLRRPRAGAGRGRLHPDARRLPGAAPGAPRPSTGSSTSPTRCSRASAAPARSGRWSTTASSPDLLVAGKSLGGGLPLASVTGRAELMDAPAPGGLGGTFGGNPAACAAANATLELLPGLLPRAREIGEVVRARLEQIAPPGADVRGLGPMLALELPEQSPDRAAAIVARGARGGARCCLSCGLYGNVIRLHVPFVIEDGELSRGLEILERAVGGSDL